MEDGWFNSDTGYLSYPPLYRKVSYVDFKAFYGRIAKKKNILKMLESYCQELRKGGLSESILFLLVSDVFLNKNEEVPEIHILPFRRRQSLIDTTSEFNYFFPRGSVLKKYAKVIYVIRKRVLIDSDENIDSIENNEAIKKFSMDHGLTNIYIQNCMVLLSFEEIR